MRKEIIELIEKLDNQGLILGQVLDVGGNGTQYQKEQGYDFKAKFKERGYKILDIKANEGVDIVADASKYWTKGDDKPNTIILTEMLEHCENPWAVIDRCYKNLMTGGIIIVTVPDIYGVHCGEDYYRFTENGLKVICNKFAMIEFGSFGSAENRDLEHYFVGKK